MKILMFIPRTKIFNGKKISFDRLRSYLPSDNVTKKKYYLSENKLKSITNNDPRPVIAIVYSGRPEEFLFGKVQV